jgi:hypothetical protein
MPSRIADPAARLERQLGQLLDVIEARPGITVSDLCRRFQTSMRTAERDFALDLLIEDGYVRREVVETGARPKTLYWPTAAAKPRRKQPGVYEPKIVELARQRFKQTFLPFAE